MALVGFRFEPVSLDVNKVCFEEKQDIPNTREKSRKSQGVTEWCKCGKWDRNAHKCWVRELRRNLSLCLFKIWDTMIGMCSAKELVQQSCSFT